MVKTSKKNKKANKLLLENERGEKEKRWEELMCREQQAKMKHPCTSAMKCFGNMTWNNL